MEVKHGIPSKADFIEMANQSKASKNKTLLALPVPHEDVIDCDISQAKKFFENIVASKSVFRHSVLLSINGYDLDKREVFEIEEIQAFIKKLVKSVPHLLYYTDIHECFPWIMACYADKATSERPPNLPSLDAVEASYRRFTLGENLDMPVHLVLSSEKIKLLSIALRVLGLKINDTKHTDDLIQMIEESFRKK